MFYWWWYIYISTFLMMSFRSASYKSLDVRQPSNLWGGRTYLTSSHFDNNGHQKSVLTKKNLWKPSYGWDSQEILHQLMVNIPLFLLGVYHPFGGGAGFRTHPWEPRKRPRPYPRCLWRPPFAPWVPLRWPPCDEVFAPGAGKIGKSKKNLEMRWFMRDSPLIMGWKMWT